MRGALILVLLILGALPSAGAQEPVTRCAHQCSPDAADVNPGDLPTHGPVNVIAYAHFFDTLGMAPLNVLPPDPAHERDLDKGFLAPTIDTQTGVCPAGQCLDVHLKNAQWEMYFCPGEIQFMSDHEWFLGCHSPSLHGDIVVGPGHPVVYWYIGAAQGASPLTPDVSASAMPNVRVSAELRDRIGPHVYARGVSSVANIVALPNQPPVYEFPTELIPTSEARKDAFGNMVLDEIPLDVRVSAEQVSVPDRAQASQADLRVHTGPLFPPRIVLPMLQPLSTTIDRTVYEGRPYLRASITPQLGSYDVDPDSIRLRLVGPNGDEPLGEDAAHLNGLKRSIDHDGVLKPVVATWMVNTSRLNVSGPDYHWEVTALNRQHTYETVASAPLDLFEFKGASAVPAPGLLAGLVGLVLGGAALRRGGRP